jgi:hypothetical protein
VSVTGKAYDFPHCSIYIQICVETKSVPHPHGDGPGTCVMTRPLFVGESFSILAAGGVASFVTCDSAHLRYFCFHLFPRTVVACAQLMT